MSPKPQSFLELVERYGKPWDGPAAYHAFEAEHMDMWRAEDCESRIGLEADLLPFKKMYVNKDIIPLLDTTFLVLKDLDLLGELKTYDGCWNVRPIRGTEADPRWSIHSFGLALDFNAATNPMGGPVAFSPRFLAAWKACGWTCGADFHRVDGMHFQWADHC